MENEREDLNDSVTSLRKKSSSWSHCERQKFFRKYHKLAESKLTSTRAQRNDRRMGFISQTVTKNTERGSTVYSKESPAGMPSKQWQSDQRDAINSFYKSLKSKTMKIGIKKKQTDETNDSIWILRIHKNDDSVLNQNAVKKLKVYGYFCHVRLHQTHAILQGRTKFLKLKIHLPYKNIQQIHLIYANERLEQIMIKMVKRKIRFTTKRHIFKDLCQLWRTAITLTNNNRKHALNGNDVEKQEQQRLVEKLGNNSTATDNDIDDNDGMDKSYSPSEGLSSEVTCTTVSSTLSLPPLTTATTMIGVPDSEFSINDSNGMRCQGNDNNDNTDNIEVKVACQCQTHLGRLFVDKVYPLTIQQLFAILFSPTPWYQHLEEIVSKTTHGRMLNIVSGYVATSWITENPTVTTRTVTYNMALNNTLGPKSTSVTEKQTCYAFRCADDGFSVMKEIHNAGVPCADNFIIQCTYCVIRTDHTHSRLLVHGAMVQKKSIWGIVKGIIEKSTYSGLETHYTVLGETLKLLCEGSAEPNEATVSKSEATGSIISSLLPNKLLNGKCNNRRCTEYSTSTVPHYQTKILKSNINSAEDINITKTANNSDYIYDNPARIGNDAQTQTLNYFSDKETVGYSVGFVIILLFILLCLQLFTFLKISYISDAHCACANANSAFTKAIQEQNKLPINAKNLEQLPLAEKNTVFKDNNENAKIGHYYGKNLL
ncbi:hypothetical protein ACH3XW_17390 [Acanthocheilonema viteae]